MRVKRIAIDSGYYYTYTLLMEKKSSIFTKWWFWVGAFVFVIYLLTRSMYSGAMQQVEEMGVPSPTPATVSVTKGTYLDYEYEILKQEGEDKTVVTFTPFLARNDGVLKGAMIKVMSDIYGKHKLVDLEPKLTQRNGTGLIYYTGEDYNYYFLIIKEDTGEVHSFTTWAESL